MSGPELAKKAGWDHSKISRMETGNIAPSDVDVVQYLIYCGLDLAEVTEVIELCRVAELDLCGYWLSSHRNQLSDSARSLIYHETAAIASTWYEPQVVPGLLQTEAYVRALTTERWPDWDIDRAVQIRMDRQQILHRWNPAKFSFFVHEHALRLEVGSPAVMHEQLINLMLMDTLPNITVRVLTAAIGLKSLFGGAFLLFEFAKHPPLIYLDGIVDAGLFLEDQEYVDSYRQLFSTMSAVALDEGQSREFLATLANDLDRGSPNTDVEEEQL